MVSTFPALEKAVRKIEQMRASIQEPEPPGNTSFPDFREERV
jgi:hypothetical protein